MKHFWAIEEQQKTRNDNAGLRICSSLCQSTS
jgi:hypothetical protein